MNYSPLRYPGGKSKIAPFVELIIERAGIEHGTYIEPFAGGAGVALSLLIEGKVGRIVINDYDKAIYSFWRALKEDTKNLITLIEETPICIEEWRRQKDIYVKDNSKYSLELGFAAFYLNRTNRSGIVTAGPIGGFGQTGNYFINARFNKAKLIDRIKMIAEHKDNIVVYNKDIRSFIKKIIMRQEDNAFVYFDPPYYNKGKMLYKNFLNPPDHKQIADLIINELNLSWMVTYDDIPEILELYNSFTCKRFDLNYSVANTGKASEIMVLSDKSLWPNQAEIETRKIRINIR